jgi:hypothetical protein
LQIANEPEALGGVTWWKFTRVGAHTTVAGTLAVGCTPLSDLGDMPATDAMLIV